MKSKRRHELQTNELADQLGQWIENIRPHMTLITLLVVGAAAIVAAWYYYASTKETAVAQAWRAYMNAGSDPSGDMMGELGEVAGEFQGTQAGLWAAQTAADMQSAQGVRLLFQDRELATKSLKEAQERYETVLNSKYATKGSMLRHRAQFGLAQTLEALGDLDQAKSQYEAVITDSQNSAIAKAAQQRVDRLESSSTQKFYNWFARQKPVPRDAGTGPAAGGGVTLPGSDLGVVPDVPSDTFMQQVSGGAEEPADSQDASAAGPPSSSSSEAASGAAAEEPAAAKSDSVEETPPAVEKEAEKEE